MRVLRTLRRARELERFSVRALDGDAGHLDDFFFDERTWDVRFMRVSSGGWLRRRCVLVAPAAVDRVDGDEWVVQLRVSREQLAASPAFDADGPISERTQRDVFTHYNWIPYWDQSFFPGPTVQRAPRPSAGPERRPSGLCNANGIRGFHIRATDGRVGHVEDVIIDDLDWAVRYLEVDTRDWLPGRKVLLAPAWVDRVDWAEATVHADQTQEAIRTAPAYHPQAVISRDYEVALYTHYGKREYWK